MKSWTPFLIRKAQSLSDAMFSSLKKLAALCADRRLVVCMVLSMFGVSGLNAAVMVALGVFIDDLVYGGRPVRSFTVLVCSALGRFVLELLLRRYVLKIGRDVEVRLQWCLLDAFQKMKPSAVDCYRNGEVGMKFFRDAGWVQQFAVNLCPQFLNALAGVVLAFAVILWKKPAIALFYLIFLPLMVLNFLYFAKRLTFFSHAVRRMYDRSLNGIFEFMHIFPYLKSMAAEAPYFEQPRRKFKSFRKMNLKNDCTASSLEYINRFILLLGEYSVLAVAGWLAWKKEIPVGDVVVFQGLFLAVLSSLNGMFQLLPGWKSAQESAESISELLETEDTEDIDSKPELPSALADIAVRHVSFRYPHSRKAVFADFSCDIKAGSIVALTGANGTGKTTLLKLITGYLEPESGRVEIAGRELKEWRLRSFRQKVAYVFQDSLLITGTVRENITLKNSRYTEAEIAEALRLSGADGLVVRLPEGLEHRIGFEGGGLSGGERQKLAIARALIRKPDILIFDEVTNHLDYESRMKIRALLISLRGKATVLMVSHDPELAALCDQEICLNN